MSPAERLNSAAGYILERWKTDGGWWIAEALFVAGWSLLWASALGLVSFVPGTVSVMFMLAGALLPGILLRPLSLRRAMMMFTAGSQLEDTDRYPTVRWARARAAKRDNTGHRANSKTKTTNSAVDKVAQAEAKMATGDERAQPSLVKAEPIADKNGARIVLVPKLGAGRGGTGS